MTSTSSTSTGQSLTPEQEAIIMSKLECLKELRNQNIQYEKLKKKLKEEMEKTEIEETCLVEYKKELELLIEEKMAHVDELRQIHSDINSMETVINQSEEERKHHLETAKRLYQEFKSLKESMDRVRTDLGLPELHEEDERFKSEFFKTKLSNILQSQDSIEDNPMNNSLLAAAANVQHSYLAAAAAARVVKSGLSPAPGVAISTGPPHPPPPTAVPGPVSERQAPSAFRQQPPPMKACLSCHQQIHRNAPICPLCKAKSRSRNPKKPKRKLED